MEPFVQLTADDVVRFLDQGTDPTARALAEAHLPVVRAYVKAYTRGHGFNGDMAVESINAVIMTATARLMANPMQHKREELNGYAVTPTPFAGFTIAESLVLNAYRKRTR